MKKFFSFSAVVALVLTLGLASCSKSTPDLINEYKEAVKEQLKATESGDAEAASEAAAKALKIANELQGRNLTPEENQQILEAAAEIGMGAMQTGQKMANDAMETVSGMVNDSFSNDESLMNMDESSMDDTDLDD